jgi:protein-tyrosine phosphatase
MAHIDLHLHLLPGVDDGSPDESTALDHAARMVAAGVDEATVTPHVGAPFFPLDPLTVPDRTRDLQQALDRAGIPLTIHPGGEIHPDGAADLGADELDAIAHGPRGARWVLAEVPFAGIDECFLDGLAAIRRRGYGTVIAHPERAAGLLERGLAQLRAELAAGAVLQVNVCSLLGRHGDEARHAGRRLVRNGLAYVLASDGHPGHREHTLADGVAPARAADGTRVRAWQLTQANPRFLLRHGLPALTPPPVRTWRAHGDGSVDRVRAAARRMSGSRR